MIDPITAFATRPSTGASSADSVRTRRAEPVESVADFATLLGDAIAGVSQKVREAEAVSISGIKGVASTQDVVETVMRAEQSLQAAISVRDKIVSAYMEISRMAI